MIDDRFYYEFEQRFRGTREEITERLNGYIPLLAAIESTNTDKLAVDFGCGRGEWLKLLSKRGWNATGVDANPEMLKPAEEDGLSIVVADALEHIRAMKSESVSLITGFHIVEHLPAGVLHELVAQSYRVLKNGGMIIFETPNPENFLVGSNRFYMDPTHVHPLPPNYLKFIAEFSGFESAHAVGINQPNLRYKTGAAGAFLELTEIFPDYSVIAQKGNDIPKAMSLGHLITKHYKANSPYSYIPLDKFLDRLHELETRVRELSEIQGLRERPKKSRVKKLKNSIAKRFRKVKTALGG